MIKNKTNKNEPRHIWRVAYRTRTDEKEARKVSNQSSYGRCRATRLFVSESSFRISSHSHRSLLPGRPFSGFINLNEPSVRLH